MNKNVFISGIAVALIVGGIVGYTIGGSQYSAQIEKAKKFFPTTMEVRSIFGTIKKVSGNTVTIQTQPSNNPFEDLPTVRNVVVTSKTKIIKNEPVDPKVYQEEMAAYQAAVQKLQKTALPPTAGGVAPAPAAGAGVNFPTPPMMFKQTELKVSDLKEGNMISIEADKNIKTETSFEATTITVTGTAAGPAAAGSPPQINTPPAGTPLPPGPPPQVNTPLPPPQTTNLPPPAPPKP